MSQVQVSQSDMADASNAAQSAADRVRGHGSQAEIVAVVTAVPGARAVDPLIALGDAWEGDVESWAAAARAFGDELAAAGEDYRSTDTAESTRLGSLGGGLRGLPEPV